MKFENKDGNFSFSGMGGGGLFPDKFLTYLQSGFIQLLTDPQSLSKLLQKMPQIQRRRC